MASKASSVQSVLPRWTKRVATDVGGRDPLGLSRVAQGLADILMPGIITTTNRARYYALYCWILWDIEQRSDAKSLSEFRAEFQRREAAIALATVLDDAEASPVGVRVVKRRLAQAREDKEIAVEFQVLPANALGGFGQYYAGCLYQLGLTHRPEGDIDRVSPGVAEGLAGAVHATLAATPYVSKGAFRLSHVPLKILEQSSERLAVHAIRKPFAKAERAALIDLFFGFSTEPPSGESIARRSSLARILSMVESYEAKGALVSRDNMDLQLLYGPSYFDTLVAENGEKRLRAALPPGFAQVDGYWRQFCLQQYLTQALEELLVAMLRSVEQTPEGLSRSEVVDELIAGRQLSKELGVRLGGRPCESPRELLKRIGVASIPDEPACIASRKRYPFGHALCEESLTASDEETVPGAVARACLLLGVLYAKWRGVSSDPHWLEVARTAAGDPCAPAVLPRLDAWLSTDTDWPSAVGDLVDFVISQHDRVMYSKGRLDSRWLSAEEGRLLKEQDYLPYFRAARHRQAVEILTDLELLRGDGEGIRGITAKGRDVLKRVRAAAS